MSQSPLKKLWAAVLHQYHKPESLLMVCCFFSVIMLVWLLFIRPDAEIDPQRFSGPATAAAATTDVEDSIYAGTLVRQTDTGQGVVRQATATSAEVLVEPPAAKIYIAIILDDIGNNDALGMQAIALPGAVTYAVLPHTLMVKNWRRWQTKLGKKSCCTHP